MPLPCRRTSAQLHNTRIYIRLCYRLFGRQYTACQKTSISGQEYDYETACGANGKPYFKGHANLYFNLSHSGNFAVCIVAGIPCGIDIEGNRPFKPSVAKRFFSKTEYHWIYDTENVSVQTERFFRLWTLKEAYAKATGNGIAAEIYAASYVPDTDSDGLCFADSETAAHFQIKEAEYNGLRIAAVLSDSAF